MYNKKSYNGLLTLGIVSIIAGLALLIYCITSYSEIKLVTDKIDFDELDNNIHISTSDKYYKHLSVWDTLNQKLEKNKNLPIKNMSCGYLDYAQHNIKSLYKLIYKSANEDTSRRTVVEGNIKSLSNIYDNYKSCRKTALYKEELNNMLKEIEDADDIFYQGRMETFLNGSRDIERVQSGSAIPEGDAQAELSHEYGNQIDLNQQNSQTDSREEQYRHVQQYINYDENTHNGDAQNYRVESRQH